MFCSKCGKNVDDGVGFCPSCGTKVGGGVTACAQRPAGDSGKVSGAGRGKLVEYLVGAVFAVVVACGVLYRIMGTGPDLREEATGLLRGSLVEQFEKDEDTKEVAKYIKLTDVRDCVLVKESKGRYSGLVQAEYTANKVGKKGETRRVVVQYDFTLLYDGENIMLKNAEPSDSEVAKFTSFVEKLVEEEEGEGGEPDDDVDEKESDGEGDEDESEEQAVVDTPQKHVGPQKKSMSTESEPNDDVVMTGSDFIKEWEWITGEEGTRVQQEARFKQIKGRRVVFDFDNAYVDNVTEIDSAAQNLNKMVGEPTGKVEVEIVSKYSADKELRMELFFSDKNKVEDALKLNKGTAVKSVSGRVAGRRGDVVELLNPAIIVE